MNFDYYIPTRILFGKGTLKQGFDALFHSTEGYLNSTAYVMSDMYALQAITLIGKSLERAVTDGTDIDARGDVALANTLAGMVESTSGCTSEHSMAHAISAFHPNFEHGAALIAISREYYTFMAESGACDERMIAMAKALGKADATKAMDFVDLLVDLQEKCDVANIKMSSYGMKYEDLDKYVVNAMDTMGGLYTVDPIEVNAAATLAIYQKSFQ